MQKKEEVTAAIVLLYAALFMTIHDNLIFDAIFTFRYSEIPDLALAHLYQ